MEFNTLRELLTNGLAGVAVTWIERFIVAECASTYANRTITVWARKPRING